MKRIILGLTFLLLFNGCAVEQSMEYIEEPKVEVSQPEETPSTVISEEVALQWTEGIPAVQYIPDWDVEGSTEEYLTELCDPKYGGRLCGDIGNELVIDWMVEQFSYLGLEIMDDLDSYRLSYYDAGFEQLEGRAYVVYPDGNEVPLELGRGWTFRASWEEIDLTLPLSANLTDCEEGEAFLDANLCNQGNKRNYIEILSGDVTENMPYHNRGNNASRIKVSEQIYKQLTQEGVKLHLALPKSASNTYIDNLIAYLPGENKSKAVMITANFDGPGLSGGFIPAAYNNASGIATMLQTAKWLSQAESLPCDVIFAAFNGDQYSNKGLDSVVSYIEKECEEYEQVLAINLKCLGWQDEAITVYGLSDQAVLRNELAGGLGIQFKDTDIQSFSRKNVSSVTLFQDAYYHNDEISTVLNTPNDTVKNLDSSILDELSQKLCAWIMERGTYSMLGSEIPVFW